MSAGADNRKHFGFRKALFLYRMDGGRVGSNEDPTFIRFLECTMPLDKIDGARGCVYLQ